MLLSCRTAQWKGCGVGGIHQHWGMSNSSEEVMSGAGLQFDQVRVDWLPNILGRKGDRASP